VWIVIDSLARDILRGYFSGQIDAFKLALNHVKDIVKNMRRAYQKNNEAKKKNLLRLLSILADLATVAWFILIVIRYI